MKILSDKARQLRNEAQKEWRAKNPDKIRQYNITYWEKRQRSTLSRCRLEI